ncbi:ATP adenylyltransferase [Colletotrichum graminicola M1.001]|uniref:ATP adenylyltransferase n=1 Tax=Colletotrichum graminicola (strain M1.001 / M2 / FGSC 10212) TaxID=645133 RepID=E3QFA0_COLGM|nr:ATP adenylyltransferase [Colletotrichum graminicola M1.001]EFQ29538.1 ATP adenylyltransferase [Colletotrichum graminicola M1.001]
MAATAIDEASILARFDELVSDGVVMYAEDMEKVYYEDQGFKFEFRITSALESKPAAVGDNAELDDANGGADGGTHHTSSETKVPGVGNGSADASSSSSSNGTPRGIELDAGGCVPGGDISIAGYEIGLVGGGAHVLSFNKFCAYRPHLMLVTADGRRRQFEALDDADFGAAREVLMGLHRRGGGGGGVRQEYLVIFNCGKKGGCSRLHKHMQVIPAPDAIPSWPDEAGPEGASGGRPGPPFRYFMHRFAGSLNGGSGGSGGGGGEAGELPSADELVRAYRRMLRQAAALVPGREGAVEESGAGGGREAAVPHNVLLGGRWMVVIPRVTDGVGEAGVNAAGMLGVVWAAGAETVDKWKRLGPRRVLSEVGVRG